MSHLQIDLWYGRCQKFGHNGTPQRWVNVLGRVWPVDRVQRLTAALNAGPPLPLSLGRDKRRLAGPGDFNIDLDVRDLRPGENVVVVTAVSTDGHTVTETVTLTYAPQPATLPFTIDWSTVEAIQDVAHVADGRWALTPAGISPQEIGYDRTVTFGELTWQDYEVTVPITIHGLNAACYEYPSWHAGVGVLLRWKGHANWGSDGWASGQPRFGPSPYGAIGWYCIFQEHGTELNFFDADFQRAAVQPRTLAWHQPYWFKARVKTVSASASRYQLKVWPVAEPEPDGWDLETVIAHIGYKEGAVLLVAHQVTAVFGNVSVQSIENLDADERG